jgi:hypothetical protein
VRPRIAGTPVGLDLDDAPADETSPAAVDQIASEEVTRDAPDTAFVEVARERCVESMPERSGGAEWPT